MCQSKDMIAQVSNHMYTKLWSRYPNLKIHKSRSSNSMYISYFLTHATAQYSRHRVNLFTIRISDHGAFSSTRQGSKFSIVNRSIRVECDYSGFDRADVVIEELLNLNVVEILETWKADNPVNKKITYNSLQNSVKKVRKKFLNG